MAARIAETDFGTKKATIDKISQLQKESPTLFQRAVLAWWKKVYMTAIEECPVDTGALRASIRIQKMADTTGEYMVARKPEGVLMEYYIIAGGGGIINPKHRREVDYARVVHDGAAGRLGNPFLDRAIQKHMSTMEDELKKYMDWYQKEWMKDQPQPTTWRLPLRVSPFRL